MLLGGIFALASAAAADLPESAPVQVVTSLNKLYPAGSIQSFELADQALTAVGRERAEIEARFGADERACHPKFFVTSCLEDAKERRRVDLARVRSVEVEAKTFKRRARVAERDQALQERREEEEAEAPQRLQDQIENEARAARKAHGGAASVPLESREERAPSTGSTREAQHEVKLQQRQTMEIANAKKRAENVAAHQKKVAEATARQREIAAKHAEKERESKAREASKP